MKIASDLSHDAIEQRRGLPLPPKLTGISAALADLQQTDKCLF